MNFIEYLTAREDLRVRKENDQSPWTTDQILNDWSFCNVFREDDAASRWMIDNLIAGENDMEKLLFSIFTYRRFNLIETGETLTKFNLFNQWDANSALIEIQKQPKKFNSAYRTKVPDGDKVVETLKICDDFYMHSPRHLSRILSADSLEDVHEYLKTIKWVGPFGGYQFLVDLTYTPMCANKNGLFDWCFPGPGAVRGLNRLHGRAVDFTSGTYDFLGEIQDLRDEMNEHPHFKLGGFRAMDIQHNLCEYDKYHRVLEGGRMKRRYRK